MGGRAYGLTWELGGMGEENEGAHRQGELHIACALTPYHEN